MARFHTLYTAIEMLSPLEAGVPMRDSPYRRLMRPWHSRLLGRIGETQVGPTYLGVPGILSIVCGFIAIEIIGLNMWASVNWDPVQFARQLFWHALEPPPAKYGLSRIGTPASSGDSISIAV